MYINAKKRERKGQSCKILVKVNIRLPQSWEGNWYKERARLEVAWPSLPSHKAAWPNGNKGQQPVAEDKTNSHRPVTIQNSQIVEHNKKISKKIRTS